MPERAPMRILSDPGVRPDEITALLRRMDVRPVLPAYPTKSTSHSNPRHRRRLTQAPQT
ncbi:MAG TPA: hypothetical protein VHU91_08685 [Mycobacteriales bacterium]|nr:hypothetical protein [Mycobacteriales bacterium]